MANISNYKKPYTLVLGTSGRDTIFNLSGSDYVTIDAGDGDDYVSATGNENILVYAGDGNDTIFGGGSYETIYAGDGNDYINSGASYLTIDAGDGNDRIYNGVSEGGNNATINAGAGDDYIENRSTASFVTIDGGTGNDTIRNCYYDDYRKLHSGGSNVTINGGDGNDEIENSGDYVLFQYSEGDGNDTIIGFNNTSTLSIDGEYIKDTVGNDIVVSVGNYEITMSNAASLSTVNILGEEKVIWRLKDTTATYGTESQSFVTVNGVTSLDGISLKGNVVTVAKSSLGKDKVTISNGYTLALNSDATISQATVTWRMSGEKTAVCNPTTESYTCNGTSINYVATIDPVTLVTVTGVKSVDGLSLDGKVVTVSNESLNQEKVTVSNGYTLALGSNVTKSVTTEAIWKLDDKTADYHDMSRTA
ncbi:MAG: hypothetical protein J5497_08650, partial [Selenomonadaceae bacterium]|nr:hypothetical protein [Selenomonadaceae bacterium]